MNADRESKQLVRESVASVECGCGAGLVTPRSETWGLSESWQTARVGMKRISSNITRFYL